MTTAPARTAEVAGSFLRLGLTSFGGPVAHLGYFRETFVGRRSWLDDREFADLVALCQMLPGPASSQVGMGLGLRRAGLPGLAAAWVSFTLPSAILLTLFALGSRPSATSATPDGFSGSRPPRWPSSPEPCSRWRKR